MTYIIIFFEWRARAGTHTYAHFKKYLIDKSKNEKSFMRYTYSENITSLRWMTVEGAE